MKKDKFLNYFNNKRKNIFKTLLFSFSFAFVIPAFICVFAYSLIGHTVSDEINKANFYFLKDSINEIDKKISNIEQFAIQIGMSYEIKSFLLNNNDKSSFDYYGLINTLKTIRASNNDIEDLYIYINNSNTVVTPNSHENAPMFFSYTHNVSDQKYSDWVNLMNTRHNKSYINYGCNNINSSICLMQSLPIDSKNSQLATLVIILNSDKLLVNLERKEWINNLDTIVLNQNSEILNTTLDIGPIKSELTAKSNSQSGNFTTKLNNTKLMATYFNSSQTNWKYITLLPKQIYLQKTIYINIFLTLSLLIYLLIGIYLIIILTRRNYMPLSNVITNISNFSETVFNSKYENEYEFIYDVVVKAHNDKDIINSKLDETKPLFIRNYYKSILEGELINAEKIKGKLYNNDLPLTDEKFTLLLIKIINNSVIDNSQDQLVKFSLTNVCYEIISKEYKCIIIDVGLDSIALIANHNFSNDDANIESLCHLTLQIKNFFSKEFNINFSVAISNTYADLFKLEKCYTEVLQAMEYKLVYDNDKMIIYSDICKRNNNVSLDFILENHLINYIKIGNFESAKTVIIKIFNENIFKDDVTISFVKCFLYDLTTTILKSFDSNNVEYKIAISDILQKTSANEILEKILSLVEVICLENSEKISNNYISKRVEDYIDKNYIDTTLGVNTIADNFNISPPYLSKLFKDQMGISLPEYIQKYRIEKAKNILSSKKYTIKEVSQMVGFINSNTFIRAFKKQEGQTPGHMI